MNVECELNIYDNELDILKNSKLIVKNHWNYGKIVKLSIGGQNIYVNGYELQDAIDKCLNVK